MKSKQDVLQEEVVNKTVEFYKKYNCGYWNLAMRFGKTKCAIELINKLFPKSSILIAYPDNKLKASWEKECEEWNCVNSNITYVNFSSIKKHLYIHYDFFIIDEFHSTSDNEREICKSIISNSKYILALSGTVSRDTHDEWEIPEIVRYSTSDGIEDGVLADYKISVHLVDLDDTIKTADKKGKCKSEKAKYKSYTWVIESLKAQGRDFMHLALARNRLSLSSIGKMNYLRQLLKKLSDKRVIVFTGLSKVADDIGIPSYHSKSGSDKNFNDFQEGKINHLALAAMGKMGVTYRELDSVILLNFVYSEEENAQILNRCIKLDYYGKIADMHIICLNEAPEIKKLKKGFSLLDENKISYFYKGKIQNKK